MKGSHLAGKKRRLWPTHGIASGVAFLIFVFLPNALLFARAGGGGGFHDGGGDGGGGGGAGGVILLLFQCIRLIVLYPAIGFPVVIFVIIFLIYTQRQGVNTYQSSVLRRGSAEIANQLRSANVLQLVANDPNFDELAFCKRIETAFYKIQDAWCAQNLKDVQLFLSDGVIEQYSLQFAEQREEKYHDHMESIAIDDLRIIDVDSSGIFDEVGVRIRAHAIDFRQSLSDGRRLSGSTAVEPFVEIWSFLRRRGAVTDSSKPGLIEGHCPNCGAAVVMNQTAQCPNCQSLLRNGQFDWVLCEVTQLSQWERSLNDPIPGLDLLRERDIGFSRQALEDRASVIFWRRTTADRIGKIDPLRKVATDSFCDDYAASLKPPRQCAGDCAVGGVQMVSFTAADEDEPMDRIVVKIRWSGTLISIDAGGQQHNSGDLFQTNAMVLGRNAGARTDVDKSISSAHCPNCGAPESHSDANACAACGTILNSGSSDWVLLKWVSLADPLARSLLNPDRSTPPPPSHTGGLLAWAVSVATVDGRVDPKERALLERFAAHDGMPVNELEKMISAGFNGNLKCPKPAGPTEAREWLTAIVRVAISDGTLDRREMQLVKLLGSNANLSEYDIELLVKRVQAEQYAAARQSVWL